MVGETDQDRRRGGAREIELDARGEQVEALRAGDLLGLRVGDVTQQALDDAWVHGSLQSLVTSRRQILPRSAEQPEHVAGREAPGLEPRLQLPARVMQEL